ncbi:MAG: hypothetical protein J2P27_10385, partial [Actinobacteria bacterium]|nr:hypothetical protein [Actinomycetota bacterium]
MSHRKRIAATTTAVAVSFLTAAAALAGCGPVSGGASAGPGPTTQVVAAAPPSSATQPTQRTSPATPAEPPLGAGQVGTLAQVPWAEVGAGWALAQYTTGTFQTAGPVTLYLIDPAGGMYRIYRWPATTEPWTLVSWSGDKSRVLLRQQGTSQPTFHQLTMATGHINTFTLPADVTSVIGYTRPTGQNILVDEIGIVRYSLTGAFQARLSAGTEDDGAVSAPNGTSEIVSGGPGVLLVSNSGAAIRFLPVPGAGGLGCRPVRWWNSATVLASCISAQVFAPRLWLVPVSGAAPTALTPQRTEGGPD